MKRFIVTAVIFLSAAGMAFAVEERPNILKKLLETAISPIETVIGPITELGRIVITPSRVKEKLGAASSSISIIDRGDFERKKIDTVKEALRDEVGIDIRQSGAFQGTTSILTRGGKPNHTLV